MRRVGNVVSAVGLVLVVLAGCGCRSKPTLPFTMRVYLKPDATPEQTKQVEDALRQSGKVTALEYRDKSGSWAEFTCLFSPQLVASTSKDVLPTSFSFTVADGAPGVEAVKKALPPAPLVRDVQDFTNNPMGTYSATDVSTPKTLAECTTPGTTVK